MCPLRFILVFFSALLAGYFAWRTVCFSPEFQISCSMSSKSSSKNEDFNFKKMIQNGFWVFVDMASGKYLWRNLRSINREVQEKSS